MERVKIHCIVFIILFVLLFAGPSHAETPQELNQKAVELMNHGNFESALEYLLKARDVSPTDEVIQKNLGACYNALGSKKTAGGRVAEAISDFKSALYYTDDPAIRFYKGYAHYRLKEYDEAIYELEKALDLGMASSDLYTLMGRVFYDKGETVSAIALWNKGSDLYPEDKAIKELLEKAEREVKAEEGLKKDATYRFNIQYDAESDEALGKAVLDILEEAYSDVNLDLAHYPEGNTVVILYTKKAFKEATLSPDWSGGLYDGKIRLPIGGIKDINPELKAVLYHEYTHVVVRSITKGKKVATWLNEGIAEYEGARFAVRPMREFGRTAKEGGLLPIKRLEGELSGLTGKESSLAYLQSYSIVKYIIDKFGLHAVRSMLENIGRGEKTGDAVKKALDIYGLDYDGLVAEWKKSIE